MNIRFLTKIRVIFAATLIFTVVSFGVFLQLNYMKVYKEATLDSGQQVCKELSLNVNTYINSMNDISKKILSNATLRGLLRTIETDIHHDSVYDQIKKERQIATAITDAISLSAFPSLNVYLYSTNYQFYYVYNQDNSNFHDIINIEGNKDKLKHKQLLVYVDKDEACNYARSISFVRAIFDVSGNHYGYVEIQASLDTLNKICSKSNVLNVMLLDHDNNIFYSCNPASDDIIRTITQSTKMRNDGNEEKDYLVFYSDVESINGSVCMIYSTKSFFSAYRAIQNTTIAFLLCVVISGIFVQFFMSKQLVKPLHDLRDSIQTVTYENIGVKFHSNNNEIMDLKESFQLILDNLKKTTEHELVLQKAESDARLTAMQDQISPHFIRNVLYSVSITAKEGHSEKASIMCKQLADMLCYTVDSNNPSVTVEEEFNFLYNYLSLEKIYYDDSLEYKIELDESVKKLIIPRLSIQPFVENAIQHAFDLTSPPYIILIRAKRKGSIWEIEVEDNGSGFNPIKKEIISKKLNEKVIVAEFNNHETHRNGIGIVNTCQRIQLFFNGSSKVDILDSNPGTIIRISGIMNK